MSSNLSPISLLNPVLEDRALAALQSHLEARLTWLNKAYGRASKLAITRDSKTVYYPAYPSNEEVTGKEYIDLWPDEHKGNFIFFDLKDEQIIETWGKRQMNNNVYKFGASLICSFNLRSIYGETYWKNYTVSNVVNEILYLALATFTAMGMSVEADRYYFDTQNVYRSYTHNELKNQFNMRPYGVCRIDIEMKFSPMCGLDGSSGIGIGADAIEVTNQVT